MKAKLENKYICWGLTFLAVIALSILFYFLVLRFDVILSVIARMLKIFKPLIYGVVIAFLLTQLFNYLEKKFHVLLSKKIKDEEKINKLSNIISISLSIFTMFLILFLVLYILLPRLIVSILGIIETLPHSINNLEIWLNDILKFSPTLEEMILDTINDSSKSILTWITEAVLPTMENIVNGVTTGLNDMYIFIKDFIIGIVFSIYILANKSKFIAQVKKVSYAALGITRTNSMLQGARYSYKIFNGFIKGKLLTSLIIGVGCYFGMLLFRMPYALLISLLVAITNIIPFFGPFIGWIPSVILIALINPIKALYFTIFILLLQQIEGNILEPKIVGNKTGISGFWVLFAIVVFGDLFGFVGMVIGVPIFAIIYHFAVFNLNKYLAKKKLPIETSNYKDLKYIDETTQKPVKLKSSKTA